MAASVLTAPMASIGVPKEVKADEQRVALTPDACLLYTSDAADES
mgnify:CR=1 FL=1